MKSMSFNCHLYVTEIRKDAEVYFEKCISLPFAPFAGLKIYTCEYAVAQGIYDFEVKTVEWSAEASEFWLDGPDDVFDDCPCKRGDDCCEWGASDVKAESFLLECGWSIGSISRGYSRHHPFRGMFDHEQCYQSVIDASRKPEFAEKQMDEIIAILEARAAKAR